MAKKNDKYTYRVTWSEDDAEYVGLCAEFPSLSWLDADEDSAFKGIRALVRDAVTDMKAGSAARSTRATSRTSTGWPPCAAITRFSMSAAERTRPSTVVR